jgi:streptogramin lyase
MRSRQSLAFLAAAGLLVTTAACAREEAPRSPVAVSEPDGVPGFEPDPSWPTLPADWTWGQVLGVSVDARDHVWLTGRGEVMEFDPSGALLRQWSARGEDDQWTVIHGLFVDHHGFVWTNAREQHQILKFTGDGALVFTIGRLDETGGSNDRALLGRPSDMWVAPDTNEVFVVDGYTNRRVVVFDSATGEYRRHWGAYGRPPDDEARARPSEEAPTPAPQFHTVHGITGSRDGRLYVADRTNSRIQVFERDGTFVAERVIRPGSGAAFSVALSHDPGQAHIYVADGTEHRIWILRRSDLAVVGEFAREGRGPGELGRPHNLATDSRGHLYVTEADPGMRVQKFTFLGYGANGT